METLKAAKARVVNDLRETAGPATGPDPRTVAKAYAHANAYRRGTREEQVLYDFWLEGAKGNLEVPRAVASAARRGALWAKMHPESVQSLTFTLQTRSGKKTHYTFICPHAAQETADRLERLPTKFFR